MIIPPDPEKDPRLFSPSSSTPSLLPPPSDDGSFEVAHPPPAHLRESLGLGFSDDSGSIHEALPPYERRRSEDLQDPNSVLRDPFAHAAAVSDRLSAGETRRSRAPGRPTVRIPGRPALRASTTAPSPSSDDGTITPTTFASTSNVALARAVRSGAADAAGASSSSTLISPHDNSSTAKLWESSTSAAQKELPIARGKGRKPYESESDGQSFRAWWLKWKRWVIVGVLLLVVAIGVMIGLLVAYATGALFRNGNDEPVDPWQQSSAQDGRRATQWGASNSNLNLTYTASRDGPDPSLGALTQCNRFAPLNRTNFSSLALPYPADSVSVATFVFPIVPPANITGMNTTAGNGSNTPASPPPASASTGPLDFLTDFSIVSSGIGSAGTLQFVGADAPTEIVNGGREGVITVDVVVRYAGPQDLTTMVNVCQIDRDNSTGVGIFTPVQTDGKVSNVYALDPTLLPQFQVIVRLPPSVVTGSNSMYMPSLSFQLERMAASFGRLPNVDFGNWNVSSARGGISSAYISAANVTAMTSQNAIRGLWNISESINVTNSEGPIMVNLILNDPSSPESSSLLQQNDTVLGPGSSGVHSTMKWHKRRAAPKYGNATDTSPLAAAVAGASDNVTSTHSIATTFFTTQGLVAVAYLSHPPSTALSAMIDTNQGEMDIAMHPNFVGSWGVRNIWGMVNVPSPAVRVYDDPQGWGRTRRVVEGPIITPPNSLFAEYGMNGSSPAISATTITGAAYWATDGAAPRKPGDIQSTAEGGGSQLVVMGGWGDVRVSFDGT